MSTESDVNEADNFSLSASPSSIHEKSAAATEDDDFDFGFGESHFDYNFASEKSVPPLQSDNSGPPSVTLRTNTHLSSSSSLYTTESHAERQSLANQRLSEVTSARTNNASVWILVATAAMTYTLHGFSNSITNGILTLSTFLSEFPEMDTMHTAGPQKNTNSTMQGVAVGLYQVGCAVGAIACFFLTDRIGRKRVVHGLGVLNVVGVVLQTTAFSLPQLIIGRVIMGLGVGAGHATFPLFIAECVPSRIRGRATITCAAAGNFGSFFGAVVEVAFYFLDKTSAQWRVPIACEFAWAGASVILPFWCVETPRFLLRKGRYEDAIKSQARLSGLQLDDPLLLEEIRVLEDALHESSADEILDAHPPARRWYRACLAVFIQIMSSMSGIDVISFFSTQTFQSQLHFSALTARYLTMGLQACQWLWSSISVFLIDTLGRRPLVLATAFTMSLSMGCLSGLTDTNATEPMLKAAILFFFLVMCAYPVGYHLIPAMQAAELSPGATRHQITAVSGCVHFLFDFTVTLITPVAFASIGAKYYFVYLATNACTFVVVYLLFPETKGLELEAIDELFENAPTYLSIATYGTHSRFGHFGKKLAKGKSALKAKEV